ncbi:hypothetical protein [Methylobacterium sp. MA0201]|uniref:hypothetical protein n=1 Tax=Methylobacterium alsaeris TaxID=3344826 RepID=UPI003756CAFB
MSTTLRRSGVRLLLGITGGANIANGLPERKTVATVTDLGLTRKQVHEARQIRNAEAVAPGVVRRALDSGWRRLGRVVQRCAPI